MPNHLAKKMGITAALVRSWEDGSSQPDDKQMQDLAQHLGFITCDGMGAPPATTKEGTQP